MALILVGLALRLFTIPRALPISNHHVIDEASVSVRITPLPAEACDEPRRPFITQIDHVLEVVGVCGKFERVLAGEVFPRLRRKPEEVVDEVNIAAGATTAKLCAQVVFTQRDLASRCRLPNQPGTPDLVWTHVLMLVQEKHRHLRGVNQLVDLALPIPLCLWRV